MIGLPFASLSAKVSVMSAAPSANPVIDMVGSAAGPVISPLESNVRVPVPTCVGGSVAAPPVSTAGTEATQSQVPLPVLVN